MPNFLLSLSEANNKKTQKVKEGLVVNINDNVNLSKKRGN